MPTTRVLPLLLITLATAFSLRGNPGPVGPVTLARALTDAHALAGQYAGGAVVRVAGDSMLPYFGDGAVLVTKPVAPERLRLGMVVVYRNRFGETVAHRIEGRAGEGWIVRGYNNDRADSTRVDSHNLLGVVYATFFSNGRLPEAGQMDDLLDRTPVALAAPAK